MAKASWLHRIPDELSFSPGRVRRAVLRRLQRRGRGGWDRRERRGRRHRRRPDRPPLRDRGRDDGRLGDADRAAGASPRARRSRSVRERRSTRPPARSPSRRLDATGGRGFDVVIEAAGAPGRDGERVPDRGARRRVVLVGIDVGGSAPVEIGLVQSKALQVRGIIGSAGPVAAHDPLHGDQRRRPDAAPDRDVPARRRRRRRSTRPATRAATSRSRSSAERMRAAVFHGPRDVRIEDVARPGRPAATTVVLEVIRAAICGTDARSGITARFSVGPGVDARARVRGARRRRRRGRDCVPRRRPGRLGCGDLVRPLPLVPRRPDEPVRRVPDARASGRRRAGEYRDVSRRRSAAPCPTRATTTRLRWRSRSPSPSTPSPESDSVRTTPSP